MSTIYQQLYATLVGRVDNVITNLEDMAERHDFDWFHVNQVTEMLKAALLEAEARCIEAEEETPDNHIVVISAQNHAQSVK